MRAPTRFALATFAIIVLLSGCDYLLKTSPSDLEIGTTAAARSGYRVEHAVCMNAVHLSEPSLVHCGEADYFILGFETLNRANERVYLRVHCKRETRDCEVIVEDWRATYLRNGN
ncbi:MAG: hypothetical protein QY323_02830 [Patescibacteria group bacterium]|nr:MAG: hypothetical protein QY323_02830 [Patescibacteria group bacterium]